MTYGDSAWTVWSGSPINVDPTDPSTVYFVVVSQNDAGSDFDYTLNFTDGAMSTDPGIPDKFSISNAYPNPFNPSASISFDVPDFGRVRLDVYDVKGALVETLLNETMRPGRHKYAWRPDELASGVYFLKLVAGAKAFTQKVTYIK